MLHVETKALGRRDALVPAFAVPPPESVLDGDGLTLRELIAITVRHELAAYSERRAERTFQRVLTERAVSDGLAAGRVESGDRRAPAPPGPDQAVGAALEAFEDGLFLVVADGRQETDLDAQVLLHDQSTITYVRLVALAGG